MNRLFIFLGIIIVIFGLFFALNFYENSNLETNNPYDKPVSELNAATKKLINNEYYQNILLPSDLATRLAAKENLVVYFFSPTCTHCQAATPILHAAATELGITIEKLNLLEYSAAGATYEIQYTPTLIVFKEGVEVERIVGVKTQAEFKDWLTTNAK
jgi:thiol-disulfide isomerase/thioredoxin